LLEWQKKLDEEHGCRKRWILQISTRSPLFKKTIIYVDVKWTSVVTEMVESLWPSCLMNSRFMKKKRRIELAAFAEVIQSWENIYTITRQFRAYNNMS
jgi:hypothetical protein